MHFQLFFSPGTCFHFFCYQQNSSYSEASKLASVFQSNPVKSVCYILPEILDFFFLGHNCSTLDQSLLDRFNSLMIMVFSFLWSFGFLYRGAGSCLCCKPAGQKPALVQKPCGIITVTISWSYCILPLGSYARCVCVNVSVDLFWDMKSLNCLWSGLLKE